MRWFANISMRSKMLLGFGSILALLGVVAVVGYQGLVDLNLSQNRLVNEDSRASIDMMRIRSHQNRLRVLMLELLYMTDKTVLADAEREIEERGKEVDKCFAEVETILNKRNDAEILALVAQVKQILATYREVRAQELDSIHQGRMTEAQSLGAGEQTERMDKIRNMLEMLMNRLDRSMAEAVALSQERLRNIRNEFFLAITLAIVFCFLLIRLMDRFVVAPLSETVKMLGEMRNGRLERRLALRRKDEIGVLAGTMNDFANDLQNVVVRTMRQIADGDLSTEIRPKDDLDEISPALKRTIESLRGLVAEMGALTRAAVEGRLSVRGNEDAYRGGYRDIVRGVNETLDAVIGPLNLAADVVDRIAQDTIPRPVTIDCHGDFDILKNNLNKMIVNLRKLNSEVKNGFGVLAVSSAEIFATVSQMASGAAETAAAVTETATTAEEVKQTAHVSSQKAKHVQESSQNAATVSEAGGKAVRDAVEGMNLIREQMGEITESVVRLSEQGQTIGEIIATVNDLAEQSGILAVNAAIEATRAGEYGKSFAVVAQEVRNLADQSRQATTQVRTILMEIQKATSAAVMATEQGTRAVNAGVRQVNEAGNAIGQLMTSIAEAVRSAVQIAASSQQQLVGMDQIALAIGNINQATNENMASTKQLEISAKNLQELGERLKVLIERQRIED